MKSSFTPITGLEGLPTVTVRLPQVNTTSAPLESTVPIVTPATITFMTSVNQLASGERAISLALHLLIGELVIKATTSSTGTVVASSLRNTSLAGSVVAALIGGIIVGAAAVGFFVLCCRRRRTVQNSGTAGAQGCQCHLRDPGQYLNLTRCDVIFDLISQSGRKIWPTVIATS